MIIWKGFEWFRKGVFSSLQQVAFDRTKSITSVGIHSLATACPHLRVFNWNGSPYLTDQVLQSIRNQGCWSNLTALLVSECPNFNPILSIFPSLEYLNLERCQMENTSFLAGCTRLESLHLVYCSKLNSLPYFQDIGSNLRELNLDGCKKLSNVTLMKAFEHLSPTKLTSLSLSGFHRTMEEFLQPNTRLRALQPTWNLPELRTLNLNFVSTVRLDISAPNLETIDLSYSAINENHMSVIAQNCRNLTSVNLSICQQLRDPAIQHLISLTNLQKLFLSQCILLRIISLPHTSLQYLDINRTRIKQVKTQCFNLTTLDISECWFGKKKIIYL